MGQIAITLSMECLPAVTLVKFVGVSLLQVTAVFVPYDVRVNR